MSHDIMTHKLVPMHEKTSIDEKEWVIKKYGIHIPVLLITDPVCKFMGFKEDDIIKIYRRNHIIYRIVKKE